MKHCILLTYILLSFFSHKCLAGANDCPDQCTADQNGTTLCSQNGGCLIGCLPGYYGEQCHLNCSSLCINDTCLQGDGGCISCHNKTHHGVQCNETCSDGCFNGTCEIDGSCIGGCKDGFYGGQCKKICSDLCRNGTCEIHGTCIGGCKDGYYPNGEHCKPCGIHCSDSLCSSNETFKFNCTEGCKDGYTRIDCKLVCPENCRTCEQNGSCVICEEGFVGELHNSQDIIQCSIPGMTRPDIILIVTTVLIVLSFPVFFLVRCLVERKKKQRKRYMKPSDCNPNSN